MINWRSTGPRGRSKTPGSGSQVPEALKGEVEVNHSLISRLSQVLAAAAVLPLLYSGAVAEEISSVYTPLKLDACQNVTPPEAAEHGGVFRCKGYGGMDVRVAEGDLRMFVPYGQHLADMPKRRPDFSY